MGASSCSPAIGDKELAPMGRSYMTRIEGEVTP